MEDIGQRARGAATESTRGGRRVFGASAANTDDAIPGDAVVAF